MNSGGNKFFFEEDSDEVFTGVTPTEQADIFNSGLKEVGIEIGFDSMEPMEAFVKRMEMKEIKNSLLHIEYGVVDKDYVLHITPSHAKKNFTEEYKLKAAINATIINLNKIVPFDLKVEIHLPREDWEVKVLSFVIRGGASAWNLSTEDLDTLVVREVEPSLSAVCMKI